MKRFLIFAVFVLATTSAKRLDVDEEYATLLTTWKEMMQTNSDPFQAAAAAAAKENMPTEVLPPEVIRDGKTRNRYRRSGEWLVKWRNEQRQAAADLENLWTHTWKHSGVDVAHEFQGVADLADHFLKRFGKSGEVRFTWALSRGRLIVGIAEDVLEVGVSHLNLVSSAQEEVFIAGEGCFNCVFYPRQFVMNFLSGTFSVPIMRKSDPLMFQKQWTPVVEELWKFDGYPAEVKSVDYSQGMDMMSESLQLSIARAEILRDDGRRNPGRSSKGAFCEQKRESMQWMKHCVCKKNGALYVSWCDITIPCDLNKCIPDNYTNGDS